MGILGSEQDAQQVAIWDERKFDAMDYVLLCSYTYPDVPGPVMFVFVSMLIANTSLSSAF